MCFLELTHHEATKARNAVEKQLGGGSRGGPLFQGEIEKNDKKLSGVQSGEIMRSFCSDSGRN